MLGCQPRSVCLRGYLCVHNMLYILYKISRSRKVLLEILTVMESVWNTKDGDIIYVLVGCAENCVKLVWKRLIFRFLGHACDVVFLFWRCVLHFNVFFSLKKVSNLSDIAFLSIAVKNIVIYHPWAIWNFLTNLAYNGKCGWRTEMITIRFAGWISGRIVSLPPDKDIQKLLWNGNRIRIRLSETLLSIFRGFRLLQKGENCTIIHLLCSEASFQPSAPWLRVCL